MNTTRGHGRRMRQRRVIYQQRCSTFRELNHGEFAAIVAIMLALGGVGLLSSSWIGREFIEYLARLFRLPI